MLNSIQVLGSLTVILVPLIFSITPFSYLTKRILSSFSDLVPYRSLVPGTPATKKQELQAKRYQLAAWGQIVLVAVGLSGTAIWCAVTGMDLMRAIWHEKSVIEVLLSAGLVVVWVSDSCDWIDGTDSRNRSTCWQSPYIDRLQHLHGPWPSSMACLSSEASLRSVCDSTSRPSPATTQHGPAVYGSDSSSFRL